MRVIFISHSSKDDKIIASLKVGLEEAGHRSRGVLGDRGWEKEIYTTPHTCQAVIVLTTQNWLDSKWCFAEINLVKTVGKWLRGVIQRKVEG